MVAGFEPEIWICPNGAVWSGELEQAETGLVPKKKDWARSAQPRWIENPKAAEDKQKK